MRPIGFSTGALAKGDFRRALQMLEGKLAGVIELSALRQHELGPLLDALDTLDLSSFSYVSVHAPSRIDDGMEHAVTARLLAVSVRGWPIVVHADVMRDHAAWRSFGKLLLVENMDLRKSTGRNASELDFTFGKLPEASFCLDLGHARQIDATMSEATLMIGKHGHRLRQLHVSEVNTRSGHEPLTLATLEAFHRVADLIPNDVPVILESPVPESEIDSEIDRAREALPFRAEVRA